LGGLFMGLGVLAKGPLAWLPLPIFLIFTFFQKRHRKFWCVDLLWGFVLSLAIVLAWLIPACLMGGEDYAKRILLEQTVGRLLGNGRHVHPKSFFFYFTRFPAEFIPWIVFLPTAFVFAFRKGEVIKRRELLFLSIWFIFIFTFFTFSKGKKDNYLLPLYPAAAILIGWFWDRLILSQAREKGVIAGLLLLTCLVLVAFALFFIGFPEKLYPALMPYRLLVFSILSYLLIGLSASLLCFITGKKWVSFICIVITFAIFHLHIFCSLPQRLNAEWSMKAFSERILKRMEVGDELKLGYFCPPGLLFYTRKVFLEEIRSRDRFFEVFRSPQRVFMVIRRGDLDQLRRDFGMEVNIIEQKNIYWSLVLISNR
jgi:4-amino-4-deoxy-L-arabinose transferase-like glycosyltransferase